MIDKSKLIDALYEACEKDSFKELPSWVINVINKQPEEDRWIPVDEALPNDGETVLATIRITDLPMPIFSEPTYHYIVDTMKAPFLRENVIAWQPLPQKYEG